MTNTTDEFWDLDGVSLNRPGWNITSLTGRVGTPPLVGEDQQYAFRPGEQWLPKMPGPRVITLSMWTTGVSNDTGYKVDQRRQWNDNIAFLERLFWQPGRQFTLTRRWLRTDPNGDVGIQVSRALGQLAAPISPSMTGRTRSTLQVDIKIHDCFFFGEEIVVTIPLNSPTVVTNPGDYDAAWKHVYVHLVGRLVKPVLTNITATPDLFVKYDGTIIDGQAVTLDVDNFLATAASPEFHHPEYKGPVAGINRGSFIAHGGDYPWMGLQRGSNTLTLVAEGGTGHAELRFRPPYL